MRRILVSLSVFACLLAMTACVDSTAPPAAAGKAAPSRASSTRYILASGDTPPAGCSDLGNGLWLCEGNEPQTAPAAPNDTSDY